MNITTRLRSAAAGRRFNPIIRRVFDRLYGVNFTKNSACKVRVYYHANQISWASIYPFIQHEKEMQDRYGVELILRPIAEFLKGETRDDADIVIVQPWFTVDPNELKEAMRRWRVVNGSAPRLIFLDVSAHTDLRFGKCVEPYVDVYQRKALFKDRQRFRCAYAGDTNLTEYYSEMYGIEAEPVERGVPNALLSKLTLAPNFLFDPRIQPDFRSSRPDFSNRPIDLHCRLQIKGTEWYTAMRSHAEQAANSISSIRVTDGEKISRSKYLVEMRQSKLCWSPFGFGEICWRDLEAFATGAVLVKPDMSHLEIEPDLYRPGETYLPVKWDFSNLEEVVRTALEDQQMRRRIAQNAFRVGQAYINSDAFMVNTIELLGLDDTQYTYDDREKMRFWPDAFTSDLS